MHTKTFRGSFFVGMLFFALACFMLFNYLSTYETLKHILGGGLLVFAFAFALSIVDFAGLARIFTPETQAKDESKLIYILGAVWLLACIFDVFMTTYWVSLMMIRQDNGSEIQQMMGPFAYKAIPWVIALGEMMLRVSLVLMVGMFGDKLLHGMDKIIPSLQNAIPKRSPIPASRPMPARTPIPTNYHTVRPPDFHPTSGGPK